MQKTQLKQLHAIQYTERRLCTHTEKGQSYLDRTIKCPRQTTQDEYPHITGLLEFYSFRKRAKNSSPMVCGKSDIASLILGLLK